MHPRRYGDLDPLLPGDYAAFRAALCPAVAGSRGLVHLSHSSRFRVGLWPLSGGTQSEEADGLVTSDKKAYVRSGASNWDFPCVYSDGRRFLQTIVSPT